MTHHDDDQLAAWLADGPHHGPVGVLGDALARVRETGQRPGWLVRATGGTIAQPGDSLLRYAMVLVTVAALLGILAGALIAGRILPPPNPRPPVLVDKSAEPSASPPSGLVAYVLTRQRQPGEGRCPKDGDRRASGARSAMSNSANKDGSDAHRLVAGAGLVGWAADGSALLLEGNGLRIVDPSGTVLQRFSRNELCRLPCSGTEPFSFSPDGARISFVRFYPDVENSTVIAILDLASRQVTELESTRTTNGSDLEQCWLSTRCEGQDDTPRWSPDGSRLAFARQVMSPEPGSNWTSAAVYLVNADGRGLQRVTPEGWYAFNQAGALMVRHWPSSTPR